MFCANCGKNISDLASLCPECGHPTGKGTGSLSDKKKVTALLFCFFLGGFGAHRFYVGKPGTAILQIVTLGGLGIWILIDLIVIACGNFKDAQGKLLS